MRRLRRFLRIFGENVENKVDWVRHNVFVPVPSLDDIEGYNARLLAVLDGFAETVHYRHDATWGDLFEADRASLVELPARPFPIVRYEPYRTDKYGEVTVEGNHTYAVSPDMPRRSITACFRAHTVSFADGNGEVVSEHRRRFGAQRTVDGDPAAALRLLRRRPGGWGNSCVREALPDVVSGWLDGQPRDALSRYIAMLDDASARCGFDAASESMRLLVKSGRGFGAGDMAVLSFRVLTRGIDALPDPGPDLSVYDESLMAGRLA